MMDWTKNLISYSVSEDAGKCPSCGSKDVEVNEYVNGNRKSLTFVCKNCKSSDHFDGMATDNK